MQRKTWYYEKWVGRRAEPSLLSQSENFSEIKQPLTNQYFYVLSVLMYVSKHLLNTYKEYLIHCAKHSNGKFGAAPCFYSTCLDIKEKELKLVS